MREFDLSHKTDLRFSSPKHDVCLCDDGASFTPLESGLEAVLDPSLTTPSLVAPPLPSTLRDHTTFNMTLPDPPLPLAPSTGFEVGKTFTVNASVDEDDVCYDSDNDLIEVHHSDATLVGRSYGMLWLLCQLVLILLRMYPLTTLIHSMFPLQVHHPPLPLSAVIYHSLHVMICLRGMR